jgi:hypothetical protein
MLIKDLEMSKELGGNELAAVRGGDNFAQQIGSSQLVDGKVAFASPVIQANPQTITQSDDDTKVDTASLNNVGGVMKSYLKQSGYGY